MVKRIGCCWCLVLLTAAAALAAVDFDIPRYEPPEDNAFDYYRQAFEAFPPDRPWDALFDQLDSASVDDAEVIALRGQESLDLLRLGLGKPCVMPSVEDASTPLPYLRDFRSMVRLLAVESWVQARRGDFAAAFQSELDALALGQDVNRNGALIHKLVSIACEAIACRQIRRTVGLGPDAPALAGLMAALPACEQREVPLSECLALEYAAIRRTLEKSKQDPKLLEGLRDEREAVAPVTPQMIAQALADLDTVYSPLVATSKLDYWRRPPGAGEVKVSSLLIAQIVPSIGRTLERDVVHRAALRGTLLVAALGLHFARHGQYPAELAELVPGTLEQLPVDPFSGEPFRYTLDDPLTYQLYSVGPNMRDDGGVEPEDRASGEGDIAFSTIR